MVGTGRSYSDVRAKSEPDGSLGVKTAALTILAVVSQPQFFLPTQNTEATEREARSVRTPLFIGVRARGLAVKLQSMLTPYLTSTAPVTLDRSVTAFFQSILELDALR